MSQSTSQQQLQDYFEDNLKIYLDLLREMVSINSFTANPVGINALGKFTANVFAKLGFVGEAVQSVHADFGQHLILTKPGTSGRTIGLVSHLDTVFPPEEEVRNNFAWREVDEKIYGPGTVDIKGGTVLIYMILAALKTFDPEMFETITWVILLDAEEERGGTGFGELCIDRLGSEALACFVFEMGLLRDNTFSIVEKRKGMAQYRVTVTGRSAHAGNRHQDGANAVVQLAEIIEKIAALTDHDQQLTYNVGIVSGGTGMNRVPHEAEAFVEMRAFEQDIFEQGIADMLALQEQVSIRSLTDDYPCHIEIDVIRKTPPWPQNPGTAKLHKLWTETAESMGMAVHPEARGGLSDGNHIWHAFPTLDGLGPSGGNMHCSEQSDDGTKEQEYVDANSMVPKATLNALALMRLIEEAVNQT
ncbi:MAG: M20/M25/M40 family metallo-hydrolase [Chloroflexota bacterium]